MNFFRLVCLCKNRGFVLLFFLFLYGTASAQSNDPGGWVMFFNQTRLHTKWSLHTEAQFRSYDLEPNTEQLLLRAGINYHYNPNIILTAGYGHIFNFADDGDVFKPQTADESRTWEQATLKSATGRLFLEHRYRFEQRWIRSNSSTAYKNRIRYLLRATVPINKKTVEKNTVFLTFYDEVFIHVNNAPFDRNRLYGALGFQFSPSVNVQAGWLIQTVGTKSKQFLQLGVNFNPDLRKKEG